MPDYSVTAAVYPLGVYAITGVDTGTEDFVIDGDQTARILVDDVISVVNSTGNDAVYTVASTSYASGPDETTITVNEDITDATVDGEILHDEIADVLNCTEGHDDATDRDADEPDQIAGAHVDRLANEIRSLGDTLGKGIGLKIIDNAALQAYHAGGILIYGSGAPVDIAPGVLTVADDDDSYVEVDKNGAISSNVVGFSNGKYPLAVVTAAAGDITNVLDRRGALYLAEWTEANLDDLAASLFDPATELTLATGAITRTHNVHSVDTEGDVPSDDLVTINGGADGMLMIIRAAHTDRTVVVKETDNIALGGSDITLDAINKMILLYYEDAVSKWLLIGGGGGGASQLSDLSDVSAVLYTAGFVLRADGAGFVAARLDHADIGTITAAQHHAKYTDGEAVSAMGATADGNTLNHDRYVDGEAVSAMGALGDGNPLNHDRYVDAEAIAAAKTVKLDDFAVPDDNQDLDFDTARHGLTPKGTNVGDFLKDDGTWADPAGAAGEPIAFEVGHGEILDGISDDEFHRFQLQAGETFTLVRLELQLKGGGTDADVSIDVYDDDDSSQLDSVTAGSVSKTGGVSTEAALILVRASNASGADVNATIIVHGYIKVAAELVALSMGHGEIADGLSDEEIHRFQLQTGETFTLLRLELQLKGGGTDADVSVDVYDSTGASQIDSVTAGSVSKAGGVSGTASLVLVRLSNASGGDVNGTIIVHGKIES